MRLLGVMRIALSSPEWGGLKRENRTERDGTSKCYRWLAKDDLMTKTGYGYAKCLTVAGTATTATGNFDQGILENISAQNPLINIWTHSNPRTSIDNYQAASRTECYGVEVRIAVSTQPG